MYDFGCLEGTRVPILMVAGTVDSYCPPAELARLAERSARATAVSIEGADHFFFGKLFPLGQAIEDWARRLLQDRAAR
jgi:alpha/beta superfamily hydrolase